MVSATEESTPRTEPVRGTAFALTLLVVALWGGNSVAVVYSVDSLPPIAVAGMRFALGTIVMLVWCRIEGTPIWLTRTEWTPACITALLLFAQISTFNVGVLWSNSTHGVTLINTYIFGVATIEHFVLRSERMTWRQWLGMFVSSVGVVCVMRVRQGGEIGRQAFLSGDMILLVSAFLLAVRVVYIRHVVQKMTPSKLILWHDMLGVLMFAACSLMTESFSEAEFTTSAIAGLLYQGLVVAGLCFVIQASLLRHHAASQISVFFFATPVFGVIFSVLLRGEPFNQLVVIGATCVATGIWLVTNRGKQDRSADPDSR
ncbi:MAG: hypothetical protein CMJ80_02855 [Planctomycetaceae bacterium]|nr:hypothetical protein [Planctomycetaceae bacterium]